MCTDFPLFLVDRENLPTFDNFATAERIYFFGQLCKDRHYYSAVALDGAERIDGYPVQISTYMAQQLASPDRVFFTEPHIAVTLVVIPDNYRVEYHGAENLDWVKGNNTRVVTFAEFLSSFLNKMYRPDTTEHKPQCAEFPLYLNLDAWQIQGKQLPKLTTQKTYYVVGTHDKTNRLNSIGTIGVNHNNSRTLLVSTPAAWTMWLVMYASKYNFLGRPHHAIERTIIADNQAKDMYYDFFKIKGPSPKASYFTDFMKRNQNHLKLPYKTFRNSRNTAPLNLCFRKKCYDIPWYN
jgi:hypothetical protein